MTAANTKRQQFTLYWKCMQIVFKVDGEGKDLYNYKKRAFSVCWRIALCGLHAFFCYLTGLLQWLKFGLCSHPWICTRPVSHNLPFTLVYKSTKHFQNRFSLFLQSSARRNQEYNNMVFLLKAIHNTKQINSNLKVSSKSIQQLKTCMYKPQHILPLHRGLSCSCEGKLNVQIKKPRKLIVLNLFFISNSYFTEVCMLQWLSDNCSQGTLCRVFVF